MMGTNYKIIKVLHVNLDFPYCFLFVLRFNLPPWIAGQGHKGRPRVFCSESFSRLFCDEVVAHKSVTLGVRAGGLTVIHYPTRVQSSLINPVREMKLVNKCN